MHASRRFGETSAHFVAMSRCIREYPPVKLTDSSPCSEFSHLYDGNENTEFADKRPQQLMKALIYSSSAGRRSER
jgi:hypothetical protein